MFEDLRALVLRAHDYMSLLQSYARAVEILGRTVVERCSIVLRHPEAPNVLLRYKMRNGVVIATQPAPYATHPERALFGLDSLKIADPDFCADPVNHANERNMKFACSLLVPLHGESGPVAAVLRFDLSEGGCRGVEAQRPLLDWLTVAAEDALAGCHQCERLRRERDDMQEVFEAAASLQTEGTGDDVALEAARAAVQLLHVDRCAILLYDARARRLAGIAAAGFSVPAHELVASAMANHGPVASAFMLQSPEWHPDLHGREVPFSSIEEAAPATVHHAICLPLLARHNAVGVLYLDHLEDRAQVYPGRVLGLQLFANAVASALDSAELLAEVGRLAKQDGLTGLANRQALTKTLEREVARAARQDSDLSVLMIDLDCFKRCNDEYGHLTGDQALIATAELLVEQTRQSDFVARFGGDEFVVVMPDTDADMAETVRRRIIKAARLRSRHLDRPMWKYGVSCGVHTSSGSDAASALEMADRGLYREKERKARRELLLQLLTIRPDKLHTWNHTLGRLMHVLYEKEPHYYWHSVRVMELCVPVAWEAKWSEPDMECLALAALLHDIGKIAIPGMVLSHPGPLREEDLEIIRRHPEAGKDLLSEIPYLGEVVEIVASHHERWDGDTSCAFPAYPGERHGEAIHRAARLLKIADSFDAMISPRPYTTPLPSKHALSVLRNQAGKAFDPELTELFVTCMRGRQAAGLAFPTA